MDEREELIKKFSEANPIIEELIKYENKLVKNEYFKIKVVKKMLIPVMIIMFIVGGSMSGIIDSPFITIGCFIFFPAVVIVSFILCAKNKKEYMNKIQELQKDPLLAFLPPNYRDADSTTNIRDILTNLRAYNLSDAINVYEMDLHNRIMEARH